MTEHSWARRRPRAPRGRHTARPGARPSRPSDAAGGREARARAFGDISPAPSPAPAADEPALSAEQPTPVDPAPEQDAWTPATAGPDDSPEPATEALAPIDAWPAAREEDAAPADRSEAPSAPAPDRADDADGAAPAADTSATAAARRPRATDQNRSVSSRHRGTPKKSTGAAAAARARGRRRAESTAPGSLRRAAGWTVLTALVPGTGLLTTRMRAAGIVILSTVVLGTLGVVAWFLLGDPVPTLLGLTSSRAVVIGVLAAAIVVGLIWCAQILLANLAHNTKERLQGARRAVSTLLAVLLVGTVATPFALGANGVYSAQGLLGNTDVFGGTDNGKIAAGKDPWANTERLNILMLGQDAGADRSGTRPDTIMVASIDTKTGRTALFSLPRNLQYVRFPEGTPEAQAFPEGFDAFGENENLLNAVWAWAEQNKELFPGDPNPGLTATRHAVEQTLGLSIDYYGMVDLKGFEDLVNAIGGVDINVERKIPIGGGTNQSTGGKYPITGYIEPGEQHLDGYHALWYARSREGSDDFNRMCRQQRMIRIVSEEADPVTLALAFPQLVTATEKNIETNIPSARLDAFVTLAQRVQKAGFTSYPITHEVDAPGADTWGRGGHPDWDYLHQWVQASIDDSMTSVQAESVKGTEPSPAPSTIAPTESAAPAEESASAEPTEEGSDDASAQPSDEATDSSEAPAATTTEPTIDEDPLKSCLPADEKG